MKKKIFVCLIAASLLCGSISMPINNIRHETTTASAAVYDTVPEGYTGIYTIDDLYAVRNNLSGKYILMNDIDMSETAPGGDWDNGNGWKPIGGSGENAFTGTFDGNGYAVKNMHIYGDITRNGGYGLFGSTSANISRLAVIDCDIDCNIIFEGVGSVDIGVISGNFGSGNSREIAECYTSGQIKVTIPKNNGTSNTSYNIGGICGILSARGSLINSFNAVNVDVNVATNMSKVYVGGILGKLSPEYCENVYNVGNITVVADEDSTVYTGNIFGYRGTSSGTYYLKTLNDYSAYGNANDADGSALTVAQMKSKSAFTGFDFDKVWEIDPNAEYPYPTLIDVPYVSTESVEPTQPTTTKPSVSTGTKKGDMNGDGLVDAVDASLILAYYAYLSTGGTIDDFDIWVQNGGLS